MTRPDWTIETTLRNLKVPCRVVSVETGPTFVRYGLRPEPAIRVSRVLRVGHDLAMALRVEHVRLDPGADAIGLEVPRPDPQTVPLAPLVAEATWSDSPIAFALGRDVSGAPWIADLARMPHLLIAGATGSGKSVALNALLVSILQRSGPDRVRLILIDLKRVELAPYASLPHLLLPIATEPDEAEDALAEAVELMERRYARMERAGDKSYRGTRVVVVVDELADLMLRKSEARDLLVRLAQKARAAGIHLVLATQRPSTDVVIGLLKANIPGRIAFAVPSNVDSRVILDTGGAEDLLGRGDMLYKPPWLLEPVRLQGAYVTDAEIEATVATWPVRPVKPAPTPTITPREGWHPSFSLGGLSIKRLALTLLGIAWVMGMARADAAIGGM